MIDINELKTALAQIRKEENEIMIANQIQLKDESDSRRLTAIDYINNLDLSLKSKTIPEKKTECYTVMDFLRNEMKTAPDGETKQELQKKIDELLIQANIYKDLQRAE